MSSRAATTISAFFAAAVNEAIARGCPVNAE
jgi:hypothetical protein